LDDSRQISDIEDIVKRSTLLHAPEEIRCAIAAMAQKLTAHYGASYPVILCVMNGGVVITGQILPLLNFPCELDYIHATRYQGEMTGERVRWLVQPQVSLVGRDVIILDDIYDVGITLNEIIAYCEERGARSVKTAVLVNKQHNRKAGQGADFVGLECPDKFLFGYGMDYRGYLRNAAGIFAVEEN